MQSVSEVQTSAKCEVCGVPWRQHKPTCSRHAYRPQSEPDSITALELEQIRHRMAHKYAGCRSYIEEDAVVLFFEVERLTRLLGEAMGKLALRDAVAERPKVEPVIVSGMPRRIRVDLFTPAERAIWDAVGAVEAAGCDVLLTDAVILLQQARDKVADFVDSKAQPKGVSDA